MNKTEQLFENQLMLRLMAKEIIAYYFEPCIFVLSPAIKGGRKAVTYKPDFMIVHHSYIEIAEVKAISKPEQKKKWTSMRDDARVKINVASNKFPHFKWRIYSRVGNTQHFEIEEVNP